MSTLSSRLKEISEGLPRGWQRKLADACGVAPASVSDWLSGKTKNIEYTHAVKAGNFFGVSYEWLMSGDRHVYPKNPATNHSVRETFAVFTDKPEKSSQSIEDAIETLRIALASVDSLTREQAKPIIDKLFADPENSKDLGPRMAKTLGISSPKNTEKKAA